MLLKVLNYHLPVHSHAFVEAEGPWVASEACPEVPSPSLSAMFLQ